MALLIIRIINFRFRFKCGTANATMSKLEVVGKTFSTDMVIAAHAIA